MVDPEHDPSVHAEPHLGKGSFSSVASEPNAERDLAHERAATDPDEERAKHSVFDEPATLPHREPALIDRDWICRNCGYNLRGLPTGHACPECGEVERYEPPREGEVTYAKWLADHRSRPRSGKAWLIGAVVPFAGLPWAVVCSLLLVEYVGLQNFVILGPAVSEIGKVVVALMIIERGTRLIHRPEQIYLMTIGTAFVFAVVQNMLYLSVYFKNSPDQLVAWRWTISPILHCICTYIATRGLVTIWTAAGQDDRRPRLSPAFPAIALAILLHAVYNAYIFLKGHAGYGF